MFENGLDKWDNSSIQSWGSRWLFISFIGEQLIQLTITTRFLEVRSKRWFRVQGEYSPSPKIRTFPNIPM